MYVPSPEFLNIQNEKSLPEYDYNDVDYIKDDKKS